MTNTRADLEFWRNRYRSGHTPWDLGGVSLPVRQLLRRWGPEYLARFVPRPAAGREREVDPDHIRL